MSRLTGPKPWSLLLMITHLIFLIILQIAPSLLPPPTRHTFTFHLQSLSSHNDPYRAECYSSNEGGRFECHPLTDPHDFLLMKFQGRSQRPRGLRRGSAVDRLLGLRVRIPPGTWMSVSCVGLWCQEVVSASGWSLIQMNPTAYVCH